MLERYLTQQRVNRVILEQAVLKNRIVGIGLLVSLIK